MNPKTRSLSDINLSTVANDVPLSALFSASMTASRTSAVSFATGASLAL